MSHKGVDRDLEGRFEALKATEEPAVPDFHGMMDRVKAQAADAVAAVDAREARVPRIPRRLAWGGSLLAAAAAAAIMLFQPDHTSDSKFVHVVQTFSSNPAAGAWKSPTDGLLNLPGNDILSTVPSIGTNPWPTGTGSSRRRNEL
jgi:hypothetical protein